ncbi:ABC-type transport auxiliary lipoprotein family protein [Sulfurospirillum barnesii]|uniref:ABC-type uncharacterized transport system, auxiliary component n=1 Tax=Sulfurospirillum barnesii (strain ATCC 700032 / DSM 10660 / SES-3) TaxID=760154 RepID=I3XU16_SULBS|nr:ABC-type transport auxiliary lipoprotein family protein [Sulfurospirillum barnesii]AFL67440.1 ABC-type uncharacterized transport system, auxiliary component [Sulfurospirillum barnesii SES-3]
MKKELLSVCALLLLSGCSLKETTVKPYNYSLEPMVKLERYRSHNKDVLKIARIDTPSGLNSRAIQYKKGGAILPYKYGTWSETPSLKLQHLITEALQDQNHFESVISGTSMASNNLVLESVLQNFEEVFDENGKSHVYVSLRVHLVELKSGEVLGSVRLSSKKEVTNTNGAAGTVEAFNLATAEVISHLATWLNEVRK